MSAGQSRGIVRRFSCWLGYHEWSYVGEQREHHGTWFSGYNRVCRACSKRAWWA